MNHRLEGPEDAPVVALAPSMGTPLALWDAQVRALTPRFRVLRYDHRGHGGSPVPPGPYSVAELGADLLALLDRLGLARVSVCGLSLGGMVAMWVATHAPERVDRLALCCTSARLGPPEPWRERAAIVRSKGMGAITASVLERWFTAGFRERETGVVKRFAELLEATPAEGYAACCEAIAEFDLREGLEAIAAPTLALAGSEDPATPPVEVRELAAAIPGARFTVLPGAAHLANVEQPAPFSRALVEHLAGGEGGSSEALP